jgi:tetratricopeptide (TPR) repeat protein
VKPQRSLQVLALFALGACASDGAASKAKGDIDTSGKRPPSASTLYSMSKILAARSQDAEAEAILAKLIREHPDFLPAYQDLSELYLRHDRVDSAIDVLSAGVKSGPKDAVLWNNLGMCRMLQKRYEEALDDFSKAAAGVPQDARSRANLAVALGMLGRYDESLALYLQVVPPAEAHHNLGVLCEARKDDARALREFATAESMGSAASAVASQ